MLQRLQGPQEDPEEFHVFFLLCPCGIIEEQKKNQLVVVSIAELLWIKVVFPPRSQHSQDRLWIHPVHRPGYCA